MWEDLGLNQTPLLTAAGRFQQGSSSCSPQGQDPGPPGSRRGPAPSPLIWTSPALLGPSLSSAVGRSGGLRCTPRAGPRVLSEGRAGGALRRKEMRQPPGSWLGAEGLAEVLGKAQGHPTESWGHRQTAAPETCGPAGLRKPASMWSLVTMSPRYSGRWLGYPGRRISG